MHKIRMIVYLRR